MENEDGMRSGIYSRLEQRLLPGGYVSLPPGWAELVADLDRHLTWVTPDYQVLQVKQKFGGLRFYVDLPLSDGEDPDEEIRAEIAHCLIHAAEDRSLRICEKCGSSGKPRDHRGWYVTLCDVHEREAAGDTTSLPRRGDEPS